MLCNIGAHQSAAGGYHKALERVAAIGGTCLQLFSSSPRTWKGADISDEDIEKFKEKRQELGIDPVVFHAAYLINLADRGATGEKSIKALTHELGIADRCGIIGSVVHVGSWKTKDEQPEDDAHFKHLIESLRVVLEESEGEAKILIENMGTRKIGKSLEDIAGIFNSLDGHKRLGVCLDTCHLHAAGFDLSTDESYMEFFGKFDELIGLDRLDVIHVNDSRDKLGSLRDRHDNIGEGSVGKAVFKNLVTKSPTKVLPLILETPGFDGGGPDKKNIDRLRGYAG